MIYIFIKHTHTHTHTIYIHTHIHTKWSQNGVIHVKGSDRRHGREIRRPPGHVPMFKRIYICIYIYKYIHVCVCVCVCVCVYIFVMRSISIVKSDDYQGTYPLSLA